MTSTHGHAPLTARFLRSSELFPDRPALEVAGATLSYTELRRRSLGIAQRLLTLDTESGPELTGIFAGRSVGAFAGILGILLRGHGYVPLNPRFPVLRNRELLERAGCRVLVVEAEQLDAARRVVDGLADPPALVVADEAGSVDEIDAPNAGAGTPAYLLFTSGSTGRPKGVLVRQANVTAFLDAVAARYDLSEADRFSQLFDFTFDLSAFDLFVAWQHGACVCCPSAGQLLRPTDFVRDAGLTVWFSVPSAALFIERLGGLKPGLFPTIRLSLFCGEALPAALADAWAAAAPSSTLENLYGPTEATIACTAHRWERGAAAGANGLVPIGEPLGLTEARVVDEQSAEVAPGEPGQLLLAGPQVVEGYWDDPAATARSFVTMQGNGRGYLTGDRVVRPSADASLEYLGRMDSQIKILGHRVELEEVEAVLRDETQAETIAVGWPPTPSGAAGIVAFIADTSVDTIELRRALLARLPDYMVPRELRLVNELPLNANGKRDRKALLAALEAE